jgi:hypothetical protein
MAESSRCKDDLGEGIGTGKPSRLNCSRRRFASGLSSTMCLASNQHRTVSSSIPVGNLLTVVYNMMMWDVMVYSKGRPVVARFPGRIGRRTDGIASDTQTVAGRGQTEHVFEKKIKDQT